VERRPKAMVGIYLLQYTDPPAGGTPIILDHVFHGTPFVAAHFKLPC